RSGVRALEDAAEDLTDAIRGQAQQVAPRRARPTGERFRHSVTPAQMEAPVRLTESLRDVLWLRVVSKLVLPLDLDQQDRTIGRRQQTGGACEHRDLGA